MSAEALPITAARFAAALQELPVSSLHAKVTELRNAITHLEQSNKELEDFARQEDDRDCYEALIENRDVIARMQERIELIRKEVTEVRGLPWAPEAGVKSTDAGAVSPSVQNGGAVGTGTGTGRASGNADATNRQAQEQANGTATATAEGEDDGDGVYL